MSPVIPDMGVFKGLIFVGLNTALVGAYCYAMVGRVEPLKFHPVKFVILPLMVITAMVAAFLYPWLRRQASRSIQAVSIYGGFLVVAALYGILLWIQFPDGGPRSVPLALIGAHLHGWPVFLAVLFCHYLCGRWLFGPSTDV